jgi:hypothetical protein
MSPRRDILARLLLKKGRLGSGPTLGGAIMMETVVFLMQVLSALVLIAGGVLTFSHVLESEGVTSFSYNNANDFEIDYRRVLAFARLAVHH